MKTNDTVKLFMLFRAKYGYKWANSYADPEVTRLAVSVWTDELKDFPDSWIKNGTDNWIGDWPPSLPEFKKACLPTPEQINYDIHTAAMNLAAGDTYNFKRMPADRAASAYDRAIKKLTEDLQHEMISDPSRFDSKKQLGVDNGKIQ